MWRQFMRGLIMHADKSQRATSSETTSEDGCDPQFFWLFHGWSDELRGLDNGIIAPPYYYDPSLTESECARRFACRIALSCEAVIIPERYRRLTASYLEKIFQLRERTSPREWERFRSLAISMRVKEIRREALTKHPFSNAIDS
jgi:hypothetical protein